MARTKMEATYVVHVCKNSNSFKNGRQIGIRNGKPLFEREQVCNNAWLDMDKFNAHDYPPTWRYCHECQEKGFSTKTDPKKIERARLATLSRKTLSDERRKAKERSQVSSYPPGQNDGLPEPLKR